MTYRYFSKSTDPRLFFCSKTSEEGVDPAFVEALDELRHRCGFPFVITSGYRSPSHPKERLKDTPGTHAQGIAADIACADAVKRRKIVEEALKMGFGGIGVASTFVHVDLRETTPVMWEYSR